MVYITNLFFGFLILLDFYSIALSLLNETAFTSDAQCFGSGLVVNATCPTSTSIALKNVRVGTRLTSHGCHGNETTGDGTGCCRSASDACEFDYPVFDNTLYHIQCNGIQLCRPGVERIDNVHGSCNTSVYPEFTQYMYFNYFCIDDYRLSHMDLGHFTVEDAALYLQSPNYPTVNISSGVSELSCSVETDNCNAVILIYVIERNLANVTNSTHCEQTQSLSIIEEDGSTLVNWTCNDNTYTISQPLQTAGNYILVNLTNTMSTDGGKFWIGFKASLQANLTLECPAVDKQHCFPSSTTTDSSSTSTNTTTTSTTTTPTTNSTTTSSTSTTSPTSSTTQTSSTSSTTKTSSTSSTTKTSSTSTTKKSSTSTTKTSSSTSTTSTTSTTTRTSSTTTTTRSTSSSARTQRTVTPLTTTPRYNNRKNEGTTFEKVAAVYGPIGFVILVVFLIGRLPKDGRKKEKKDKTEDHEEQTEEKQDNGGGQSDGKTSPPPKPPNGSTEENKERIIHWQNTPPTLELLMEPVGISCGSDVKFTQPTPKSLDESAKSGGDSYKNTQTPPPPNDNEGSIFCRRYYGHLNRIYPSITEGEIKREEKTTGLVRAVNFLTFRHQRRF